MGFADQGGLRFTALTKVCRKAEVLERRGAILAGTGEMGEGQKVIKMGQKERRRGRIVIDPRVHFRTSLGYEASWVTIMGKNTAVLEKGHAKRSKKSRRGLTIVSFDADFDRTERGRKINERTIQNIDRKAG